MSDDAVVLNLISGTTTGQQQNQHQQSSTTPSNCECKFSPSLNCPDMKCSDLKCSDLHLTYPTIEVKIPEVKYPEPVNIKCDCNCRTKNEHQNPTVSNPEDNLNNYVQSGLGKNKTDYER